MDLPRRYGHYLLLERIAVGGMGEIFRANYAGLAGFERPCAIKRILPHLSDDEEFIDRLISEAKIAVQLTHGNIVQVYELGRIEREYFIAMEWVDGPDLSTLLVRAKAKDAAFPLPLSIHLVRELARAVDFAHRKSDGQGRPLGIVHRDISPQNVMLTLDGGVKLGDFGIARARGIARRFATGMGAVLGKRRYMSPEQRRGEMVDHRTDVYALGALLLECLTGEAPEPDVERPPIRENFPDVSAELESLVVAALEADPEKRLASAEALVTGLEQEFVRQASRPGAIRDAAPELGRFVREMCPPGEKSRRRRSLTERMRAAMPRFASETEPGGTILGPPSGAATGTSTTGGVIPAAARNEPGSSDDTITILISSVLPAGSPRPVEKLEPETSHGGATPSAVVPTAETVIAVAPPKRTVPDPPTHRREIPVFDPVPDSDPGSGPGSAGSSNSRRHVFAGVFGLGLVLLASAATWIAGPFRGDTIMDPAASPYGAATIGSPRQEATPPESPDAEPTSTPRAVAAETRRPTPAPTRRPATPARTPRPRRTQAAVRPAARPATLHVGASPWAYVYLNGRKLDGTTPMYDLKLRAGTYVVTVENPKLGRRKQTVRLKSDEVRQVVFDFRSPEEPRSP